MATYSGTPRTWSAGETVSASLMNAEVRDPLAALAGAWNTYAPTLTQSGTVTHTATYAKYVRVGSLVICQVLLDVTGTGTTANDISCTLPVAMAYSTASYKSMGTGWIRDSSSGTDIPCMVVPAGGSTTVDFKRTDADHSGNVGNDPAFGLASGDIVSFSIIYEAA